MSKSKSSKRKVSSAEASELLLVLQERFEKNMKRHKGIEWAKVRAKLDMNPAKVWSLAEMERTGGEPDVIGYNKKSNEFIFCDCSPETPKGRRSICYDHQALESRKENKPENSAVQMAAEMGIEILTEEEYFDLQKIGTFDTKTSSWLKTPEAIRKLGGAINGDHRYGRTFIYHNGAESYFGARGFRGRLYV